MGRPLIPPEPHGWAAPVVNVLVLSGRGKAAPWAFVGALIVGTTLAGQAASSAVEASVEGVVQDNWRGAYDVLVTASGAPFSTVAGDLVDPNFVSTSTQSGITPGQLEAVRGLDGVELAAPIGLVGLLRNSGAVVTSYLPAEYVGEETVVVSMTVDVTREVPTGREVLTRASGGFAVGRDDTLAELGMNGPALATYGFPNAFTPTVLTTDEESFLAVPFGALPAFPTTVLAVDPAAEAALLGDQSFLSELQGLPKDRTARSWGEEAAMLVDGAGLDEASSVLIAGAVFDQPGATVVPLAINTSAAVQGLQLRVDVEEFRLPAGVAPPSTPEAIGAAVTGAQPARSFVIDEPLDAVSPLTLPEPVLAWPGAGYEGGSLGAFSVPAVDITPFVVGRPGYEAKASTDGSVAAFEVVPVEPVYADGASVADEAAYGTDPDVRLPAYRQSLATSGTGLTQSLAAPMATFDPSTLALEQNAASYVPLGDYVSPDVVTADGDAVIPRPMGLDFVTAPAGAITDLAGGRALRGEAPIDAIRVRVAGVGAYDQAALDRVGDVARRIEAMGLSASVVAGSSLQEVSLMVPGWLAPVEQDVSQDSLGPVSEEWTTLGAVVRVDEAFSSLSVLLLAICLLGVSLSLVTVAALTGQVTAREAAVLRVLGWREQHVVARLATWPALSTVAVTLVLAGAVVLGVVPVVVAALAVVTMAVSALAGVLAGLSTRQAAPASSGLTARSLVGVALCRVAGRPFTAALVCVAGAVVALALALTAAVVDSTAARAGATRLSDAVLEASLFGSAGLGLLAVLGALSGCAAARLLSARQAERAEAAMRFSGWGPRHVRQVRVMEDIVLLGAAGLVSASLVLAVAMLVLPDVTAWLWPVAIVASLALVASSWQVARTAAATARPA